MTTNSMTAEQAAALIEADRQARVDAVRAGVEEVLQKHRCQLQAAPQFTQDGRIVAIVQVIPL